MTLSRTLLSLLAIALSGTAAQACNGSMLTGTWTATYARVLPSGAVNDVVCRVGIEHDGRIAWSGCFEGAVADRSFAITGRLAVSRDCRVTGTVNHRGVTLQVTADVSVDKDAVAGIVHLDRAWLKPLAAIRVSRSPR